MRLTLRFKVLERDGFRCRYCGKSQEDGAKVEVDHVIPRSKGGRDTMDNLVTACFDCNRGKRDKILKELTSDIPPPTGDAMKSLKDACIKAIHDAEDLNVRVVLHDAIIKVWTGFTKRDGVHLGTFKVVFGYVDEYGFELVAMWIALAFRRCQSSDERMGRYISGCRNYYDKNSDRYYPSKLHPDEALIIVNVAKWMQATIEKIDGEKRRSEPNIDDSKP